MAFQLGSALLDACVLAIVMREDTYGYKLTQEVKQIMNVSESTLYPVLRRLQKDGLLFGHPLIPPSIMPSILSLSCLH